MSKGTPFFLLEQVAFDAGAALGAAKLYFYQTGTTTDQLPYEESSLSTQFSANPITADSGGTFAAIWLDPDAAVDYRVRLEDSDSNLIWQEDNVPRYRENFESGSFSVTWSGFSADPAATTANWYRIGRFVWLELPVGNGTSNATLFQISGLPAAIRSETQQILALPFATDNTAVIAGGCTARISSNLIIFAPGDAAYSETGWTASGSKGLNNAAQLLYRLADT